MLDINNIYVSSVNHGFDAQAYLRSIDFARVLQVHIAGHTREPAGNLVDTHAMPVSDAVWQLYAEAWKRESPFPTLLEWDDQIPPFPAVMARLAKARQVLNEPGRNTTVAGRLSSALWRGNSHAAGP